MFPGIAINGTALGEKMTGGIYMAAGMTRQEHEGRITGIATNHGSWLGKQNSFVTAIKRCIRGQDM